MPNSVLRRLCAVAATAGALSAAAAEQPLYVKNLSPVTGLLGLPAQRAAETQPRGQLGAALHSSVANIYVSDSSQSEYLNLDGETLRFALDLRYGLAERWDVQLEVPWLKQSGGELDKFIDNWHDLWGMPDGGRSDVPRNLLDYQYVSADGGFLLDNSDSGLGDITVSLNYAFYQHGDAVAGLGLGYKFGTGDDEQFLGSGADDYYIALRFSGAHLSNLPLRWHGQVGYLRAGDSDLLQGFQERNLWFAGLGLDWRVAERWSLLAQVDSNAAPTESQLTALGDPGVTLSGGVRWRFAPRWSVDASLVEDIAVETAADVVFQATLRYGE
ncbi:MAG: DUF3187 family protein [Pseudomonadales bacterium]|nr:DUF3187 family protein [Pseudomonadales bacterium]